MKMIEKFANNEKMLLLLFSLQLIIYWLCMLGMETKSQFVAYQQF
jgi:hypothetical protein